MRSVANVKQAFRSEHIALERFPFPAADSVKLDGQVAGTSFTVSIFKIQPKKQTVFLLGGGKPHVLRVHNVSASWAGPELAAVQAAMNRLK